MGIKQKEENTNGGLHNTLAAGTTVKGDIVTETDFRLDGNIVSANAEILGEVEGSIHVSAKLVLKATAVIKGDIFAQTLEIEPNARFNGVCKMSGEK